LANFFNSFAHFSPSGPLSLHRNSQSPIDPRGGGGGHQHKRLRRMSSTEDDLQDVSSQGGGSGGGGTSSSIIIRGGGGQGSNDANKSIPSAADLSYYGHQQSPNSLSNQTSWHSEMDHGQSTISSIFFSFLPPKI
jgi:hypothetical protein